MKRLHLNRRRTVALFVAGLVGVATVAATLAPPTRAGAEDAAHATKKVWTCVMHPQIVRDHPGACPICGMNLVEKEVSVAGAEKKAPKKGQKILYWVAPMDPSYRRDKPGKSPMGMDLVPVYAGGNDEGMVEISPVVVQDMGVRTAVVRRGTIYHQVRTIGSVVPAEDRLWVVNLRFSGWIAHLFVERNRRAGEAGAGAVHRLLPGAGERRAGVRGGPEDRRGRVSPSPGRAASASSTTGCPAGRSGASPRTAPPAPPSPSPRRGPGSCSRRTSSRGPG